MSTTRHNETRIAVLEHQLQGLLKWKELFVSSFGLAVAANADLFAGGMPPFLPHYVHPEKQQNSIDRPSTPSAKYDQHMTAGDEVAIARDQQYNNLIPTKQEVLASQASPAKAALLKSLADQVLDVIQAYGQHLGNKAGMTVSGEWAGRAKFAPKVLHWMELNVPVRMILPAFPWKSVSGLEDETRPV
jgi:hypothetical protein